MVSFASDDRVFPRQEVRLYLCHGEDNRFLGTATDVSRVGFAVRTPQRPDIGTDYPISFVWNATVATCKTRVARHTQEGIGLEMMGCDQEARELLESATDWFGRRHRQQPS